ncbi:hypothetical protein RHRU231_860046 [Rhodococcus ruber]|uniref:Uncharacterized protein n=1 Tax=Rhodococcus ruber TaxID=1830 RepID=A0A098BTW1_9NOCA|nr:hypothetical protein RHRU231_860046 [Rhodococcus ruber]
MHRCPAGRSSVTSGGHGAQRPLDELAGGRPGQRSDEVDAARALVPGDAVATVGDQLGGERLVAGNAHRRLDDRPDRFAHLGVGHADHRDVEHLGVQGECVLDLLRVDVDPAGDDGEHGPVGEEEVAVLVEISDVPGRRPGGVERVARLGRLLRIVVVLEAVPGTFEVDRPDLPGRQLRSVLGADVGTAGVAVTGAAHGAGFAEPLLRRDEGAADGFGGRVVLVDPLAPPVDHGALDLDRARRGRVDGHPHRGQIVAAAGPFGQLQQPDEMRGHPLTVGDAVALEVGEAGLGVEPARDDRGAPEGLRRGPEPQRRSMVDRRRGVVHATVVEAETLQQPDRVGGRLLTDLHSAERGLDSLRPAGRARRVEHVRAAGLVGRRGGAHRGDLGFVSEVSGYVAAECQAVPHLRCVVGNGDGQVGERRGDHEGGGVAVVDDVGDLGGGEMRVDERHVHSGTYCRPVQFECGGVVDRQHREVVPEAEAVGAEPVCELHRTVLELTVAHHTAGGGLDRRRLVRRDRRVASGIHPSSFHLP